jgi:Asp-tRNA(Asn)/Glu-tRNA(Gln) amidotransferase A subunit family amidase
LQEAEELDRQFSKTHVLKGPLHGVPVTFKDLCAYARAQVAPKADSSSVNIAGYDSTVGFTTYDMLLPEGFRRLNTSVTDG